VSFSHLSQDSSCFGKESDSGIKLQPSKTSSDIEQLIHHIIAPYSLVQTKRLYIYNMKAPPLSIHSLLQTFQPKVIKYSNANTHHSQTKRITRTCHPVHLHKSISSHILRPPKQNPPGSAIIPNSGYWSVLIPES
jgi:hypothetical protein